MSTEARLDRLGLLHLKDKPDELAEALEQIHAAIEKKQPSMLKPIQVNAYP